MDGWVEDSLIGSDVEQFEEQLSHIHFVTPIHSVPGMIPKREPKPNGKLRP